MFSFRGATVKLLFRVRVGVIFGLGLVLGLGLGIERPMFAVAPLKLHVSLIA